MKISRRDLDASFCTPRQSFDALVAHLGSDEVKLLTHDAVEHLIEQEGREIIRQLYQSHVDLRSLEEKERKAPIGADGIERMHRRDTSRELATVFGPVEIQRISFTAKEASGGLRPLDAELNLPDGHYSFGLQYRVADLAMDLSFETAQEKLTATTGIVLPKRQMEELALEAVSDFDAFYDQRQNRMLNRDEPAERVKLQVLTNDGKGIVMRPDSLREDTRKKAEKEKRKMATRLSPGEKANRKRMAEVASVYELEPQARTPADILPLPGEGPRKESHAARPRPENKRVWASVEKSLKEIVRETFDEALARDPLLERTWVYLVDGNKEQVEAARQMAKWIGITLVIVIDFIHVLEYLWKAAWCFFEKGNPLVERWVLDHARAVLEGRASQVAAGIRRSATQRELKGSQRDAADSCADYLLNNKDMLQYDRYLAAGMPIATGVIEGACRHLVNDRMGITGARWGLEGAEAILRLRALRISGDFKEYWAFHRHRELERNHLVYYAETELTPLRRAA